MAGRQGLRRAQALGHFPAGPGGPSVGAVTQAVGSDSVGRWPWAPFFTEDPRPWVLGAPEPAARWALLTGVLDRAADDPDVATAHADVLADRGTSALIERLPDWEAGVAVSGHESPSFAPNLLGLLADMGLRAGDDERIDRVLAQMLAHQDAEGRFTSAAPPKDGAPPAWSALLCDSHSIIEVLVRFGFGTDPRVRAGVAGMAGDLTDTAQGRAWPCRPDPVSRFRGPGRVHDFCPQVTLQALRTLALLPPDQQLVDPLRTARVSLAAWRGRATAKPYMFGHGMTFKTVKWPMSWYRSVALLDALGRYPALWADPDSDPDDRRALAELAACVIGYNMTAQGRVVPRSTYRGFVAFSFGQKRQPSAFATALLLTVLHRVDALAAEALAVDLTSLTSSKGGSGRAVPPPIRACGGPIVAGGPPP